MITNAIGSTGCSQWLPERVDVTKGFNPKDRRSRIASTPPPYLLHPITHRWNDLASFQTMRQWSWEYTPPRDLIMRQQNEAPISLAHLEARSCDMRRRVYSIPNLRQSPSRSSASALWVLATWDDALNLRKQRTSDGESSKDMFGQGVYSLWISDSKDQQGTGCQVWWKVSRSFPSPSANTPRFDPRVKLKITDQLVSACRLDPLTLSTLEAMDGQRFVHNKSKAPGPDPVVYSAQTLCPLDDVKTVKRRQESTWPDSWNKVWQGWGYPRNASYSCVCQLNCGPWYCRILLEMNKVTK